MSYVALYRKWRPLVFEDVVEQEHVVKTLKHSIETGRIAHAYLFCGTRGTGKTTMAKIFSKAINCLSPKGGDPCNECEICRGILSGNILDVVEIDAASNNSVDNIREIRDEVVYAPSQAKYKVYIIDEVHMLSTGAFNALLKTLEEPPSHVVFILATTEPHKLPATILSRCQRFDFRRITVESIMGRVEKICTESGVGIQKEAARLIARMADGAMRDALSILDQCISLGTREISYDDVLAVVGIVNDTFMAEVVDALGARNVNGILEFVDRLVMDGKDIGQFVSDLVMYYRNLLICKVTGKPEEILEASLETLERMKGQAAGLDREEIIFIIKELSLLESSLKWANHPRVLLEVSLIKLCESSFSVDAENIMDRLAVLEKRISSGTFAVKTESAANVPAGKAEMPQREKRAPRKSMEETESASVPVDMGKELGCWSEVINELKAMGRMMIYTNLLNTKAVEQDDRFIGIVFDKGARFAKMIVSKTENLEVIQTILSKKLGREVRVRCIDAGAAAAEQKKDEFVEKVEDLAKRINVPVNIIDE